MQITEFMFAAQCHAFLKMHISQDSLPYVAILCGFLEACYVDMFYVNANQIVVLKWNNGYRWAPAFTDLLFVNTVICTFDDRRVCHVPHAPITLTIIEEARVVLS